MVKAVLINHYLGAGAAMLKLVLMCGLWLFVVANGASATQRPTVLEAERYHKLLMEMPFELLELTVLEATDLRETTPDGQPRAAAIINGVTGCASAGCRFLQDELQWSETRTRLEAWNEAYPDSEFAQIALARLYFELGWFYRGTGSWRTVSQTNRNLYQQFVALSKEKLEALPGESRNNPAWFASLLAIGVSQRWDATAFDSIYEEGIQKFPDYLPLYFFKAQSVDPRWGGTMEGYTEYVGRASTYARPHFGDQLYARLIWSGPSRSLFREDLVDWPRMRKGFDEMVSAHPHPWNINHFARFACMAEDSQTLTRLLERIDGKPIHEAWYNDPMVYLNCQTFAMRSQAPKVQPPMEFIGDHSSAPIKSEE
jgi:hypothetical protein